MRPTMPEKIGPKKIGVVGMGYVGLTLTAALARAGNEVHGVDAKPAVRESLLRGRPHIFEPGVEEVFAESVGTSIFIGTELPRELDAVMISVSTPVDDGDPPARPELPGGGRPRHRPLVRAGDAGRGAQHRPDRHEPPGRAAGPAARRGGTSGWRWPPSGRSRGRPCASWWSCPRSSARWTTRASPPRSTSSVRSRRRSCPCHGWRPPRWSSCPTTRHTDLIYSFGNELALIAESHGLDPLEVIRAANLDYPRPDLAKPGYVGGGCLSKDPYIMIDSAGGRTPFLIGQARKLNEYLPEHVGRKVVEMVREYRGRTQGARVSVLGWAYKGWPATDDMRGTPVVGHRADPRRRRHHGPRPRPDGRRRRDPPVRRGTGRAGQGAQRARRHPDRQRPPGLPGARGRRTCSPGRTRRFVYDSWRILDEDAVRAAGIGYAGLGYRARTDRARGLPQHDRADAVGRGSEDDA